MEELAGNVFNRARRLSGNIATHTRRMSESVNSKVRQFNEYLDDTDIQDELVKRMRGVQPRRCSSYVGTREPVSRTTIDPMRAMSAPISSSQPLVHRPRLSTMYAQSRLFLMGGIISSPVVPRRRNTGIPLTMHAEDYRKALTTRYPSPRSVSGGASLSGISSSTSGYESSTSSSTCLEPIPDYHSEDNGDDDKLGKLFISSEYSTDENKLFVFVTQCGNVKRTRKSLRVCFSQVLNGVVSKKQSQKIEKNRFTTDFRYNYTYTVPFDSRCQMTDSGVTVQIKLKSNSMLSRKRVLKKVTLSLHDIEEDPVWRTETLFY